MGFLGGGKQEITEDNIFLKKMQKGEDGAIDARGICRTNQGDLTFRAKAYRDEDGHVVVEIPDDDKADLVNAGCWRAVKNKVIGEAYGGLNERK